jgi:hypothetical protein
MDKDKSTHELFPKVERDPKSGISPEKELVDKFLKREDRE